MRQWIKNVMVILLIIGCGKKKPTEPPDVTPPSVQIASPSNNAFIGYATSENAGGSNVTLKIVAFDTQSGIDKVEVYMNGILMGYALHLLGDSYEYTLDLFSIKDGEKINVYAKAYDNKGNANISESKEYYVYNWRYSIDTLYVDTQSWENFVIPTKEGDSVKIYLTLLNTAWNNKIDSIEVWDGNTRVLAHGPVTQIGIIGRARYGRVTVYLYNRGTIYEDKVEKEIKLKAQ